MAETVEFKSNGSTASGYLVKPASGSGPGVLVIQEWWGLDAGIKEMAERLGEAGFVALAPDLYHGELAAHDEMDKAVAPDAEPAARSRRPRHERRRGLPGQPPGRHQHGHRRRRLLHGRHAVVHHRRQPARQGQGGGAVLRISAGRRRTGLVEADRDDQRTHGGARRLLLRPLPRTRSKPSCAAWARTSR